MEGNSMSIKLSQQPPDPNTVNWSDPDSVKNYLIQVGLCIDELSRKAQSLQMEERTSAPDTNSIEEGEFVRATVGGLNYIYTKKGGTILRWQIT